MTGIDTIINDLKSRIATISYMKTVYGRATVMQELWGDKSIISIPKVWTGTEYLKPLPNDNTEPQVFFQAIGKETYGSPDNFVVANIQRQIALTFWGKLGEGDTPQSTEQIKFDIIAQFQNASYVLKINDFIDEQYRLVFPDFAGYFGLVGTGLTKGAPGKEIGGEQSTQWLMQPYGGFRLTFTVSYIQPVCQ